MQSIAVALIVALCAVYAAWTLMPAAGRRRLAVRLQRWPGLGRLPAIRRAAQAPGGGCGCSGCDAPPPASVQRVHIVRRGR